MRAGYLKTVRVVVTLLVFIPTAFLFLDFTGTMSPALTNGLVSVQFVPSILKFLNAVSFAAAGFVLILVLTLLVGRVYCSSVCPLGTLQDIIAYLSRVVRSGTALRFHERNRVLRYSILGLATAFSLSGSAYLLNLLDPFSNFGRIIANLARPIYVGANNVASAILESFGIHTLYRVPNPIADPVSYILPAAVAGLILWLTGTRGRLFCNTVCPVGTFLGLLSHFSLVRLSLDPAKCKGCRICDRVCKAECVDRTAKTLDWSRCVSCFNCLASCPFDGVRFSVRRPAFAPGNVRSSMRGRREFLRSSLVSVTGMSLIAGEGKRKVVSSRPTTVRPSVSNPVAPPGARSISHYTNTCTACHLCVSACPSRVLSPSLLEFGITGLLQPRMAYQNGFCNYDCVVCNQICPSGALLALSPEEKKTTQIGVAKFLKDNCVVYTDETDCGACSEHCPTKAVRMVPYKHLVAPEVKEENCIGCGACEFACPTKPYKAIYVDGKAAHGLAKKAEIEPLQQPAGGEEFPF